MKNAQLSSILDDQPASDDHLDFGSYVQALKELIVHSSTKTPLTLGIFGRWGTGKTTLMRMLERELKRERIATVWFNAWQYGNEDELWAAFLQSMLNKMQADLGLFRKLSFKLKLFCKRIKWRNAPGLLIQYLFRIVVVIIPLLLIDPVSQQIQPSAKPILQAGGSVAAAVLAVWIVVKPLIDAVRQNVNLDLSVFQKTSKYREHIAFLDEFREHFADVVQSLPQRGDKQLAVFIDDLDRCSPERTVQVLDAIKLFVDLRGCVYILGLDVDVVQKAVATKYKDDPVAQREYLGKIIQLPFQLPPLTRDGMQEFLEQLAIDLPDNRCREVFIAGLMVNPREVKRTINIFSLLWNLATKREELVNLITPVRLAKVVVIQHSYPELHRLLQQRPYLLIDLERFFRQEQEWEAMHGSELEVSESEERVEKPAIELPPELQSFAKSEALRRMLLLHKLPEPYGDGAEDEFNFANLELDDVAVYFTLTSRAEAPAVVETKPTFGQLVGQRYRIIEEIGRGGFATVYLAQDQRTERRVALKLLEPHLARDPGFVARFQRESQAMYRLEHPNIVRVYDHGQREGLFYYVMEYLPGGDLSKRIEVKGQLAVQETVEWALPTLDALAYAHRAGYIHRDIKPTTILFDANGTPKLTDFGITKVIELTPFTETGVIFGTPEYMSPEQAEGAEIDARSDLYAFGILLYKCLTGRTPFTGDSPLAVLRGHVDKPPPQLRELNPDIPVALEKVVMKLLEKDPAKRYQTATEVKEALVEALDTGSKIVGE